MSAKNGYTFVEMLIVLTMIFIIAVVGLSLGERGIRSQEIHRFLDQLVIDAHYIQNYAKTKNAKVDIFFIVGEQRYIGRLRQSKKILFSKSMPTALAIDVKSTLTTISFNEKGNASYAGKLIFDFGTIKKEVYVYLGSGRILVID
ncbi:type II secretion system protein [Kurthia sibirica]|uniref:Competence protein ComG n=1 Tax=Kurthia sibirica TaxID=202750 RepID=A0A2U3ALZ5_9BACL|nr:type II secretion system protein [Kurthia sibirica]PWI25534.1 hypothetical protein DEX24_07965 [Kurthia sibirica]GEK33910.1 hypothetical protein KSI01_14430 [Kurthia sibirica]